MTKTLIAITKDTLWPFITVGTEIAVFNKKVKEIEQLTVTVCCDGQTMFSDTMPYAYFIEFTDGSHMEVPYDKYCLLEEEK